MFNSALTSWARKTARVTGAKGCRTTTSAKHCEEVNTHILSVKTRCSLNNTCMTRYLTLAVNSDTNLSSFAEWMADEQPETLFRNTAMTGIRNVPDTDLDQHDRPLPINMRALYSVMPSVSEVGAANGKTRSPTTLSSQPEHRKKDLMPHYDSATAALNSNMQSAGHALAPLNIRINRIRPNAVDMPMRKDVDALFANFENNAIKRKTREEGDTVPLGHRGRPDKIARIAPFLFSRKSQYMSPRRR
ncbi:MAG: SDR family oxidoreductase [Aestuariivita sp.]|nr:SDR family oxidoreductase [Aestuariivita sp.]